MFFETSFHNAQVKAGSDGKLLESSRLLRATLVLCLLASVVFIFFSFKLLEYQDYRNQTEWVVFLSSLLPLNFLFGFVRIRQLRQGNFKKFTVIFSSVSVCTFCISVYLIIQFQSIEALIFFRWTTSFIVVIFYTKEIASSLTHKIAELSGDFKMAYLALISSNLSDRLLVMTRNYILLGVLGISEFSVFSKANQLMETTVSASNGAIFNVQVRSLSRKRPSGIKMLVIAISFSLLASIVFVNMPWSVLFGAEWKELSYWFKMLSLFYLGNSAWFVAHNETFLLSDTRGFLRWDWIKRLGVFLGYCLMLVFEAKTFFVLGFFLLILGLYERRNIYLFQKSSSVI